MKTTTIELDAVMAELYKRAKQLFEQQDDSDAAKLMAACEVLRQMQDDEEGEQE